MFLIWLIGCCAVDLQMLILVYAVYQQHELSWNPSWTDPQTLMTVLLRAVVFWKRLIENTGLPTCVCCARGAGLVLVCVTLPVQAVPLQAEVGLAGGQAALWHSFPGRAFSLIPAQTLLQVHCTLSPIQTLAQPLPSLTGLDGTAAELRTMLPQGTISGKHPHILLHRCPLSA